MIPTVGKQLKKIRQERNLTLDKASELTQVSKPMLGQIERGHSSPTIQTLWKIATGLKIPLSSLLQEPKTEFSVVDIRKQPVLNEENGGMKIYPLFPYDPLRNCETFYIEFEPGCLHTSEKHSNSVEETVFVISGKLDMIINGQKITLAEKQAVRFSANIPHSYQNHSETLCRVHNTIFY